MSVDLCNSSSSSWCHLYEQHQQENHITSNKNKLAPNINMSMQNTTNFSLPSPTQYEQVSILTQNH
jgi:hypothetical protein